MSGIPNVMATRQDWLNIYDYVLSRNDAGLKAQLRERLKALKDTRFMKVPKEGATPSVPEGSPEGTEPQLLPEDFEDRPDPASSFDRAGIGLDELDRMIGALS